MHIHRHPWASMHIDRFSIDFRGRMDPPKYGLGAPRMGIMCRPHGKMYFFDDFFIRALKLAANREKQLFTFFGFLPPYIGVSGSLTYPNRQILTRSIDCYQKFFISCLVARYWKIYRKSFENLSKIYRRSIENLCI